MAKETTTPTYELEDKGRAEGLHRVCGIDEAGRGPLAGPVFAAAVVLKPGTDIPGLNDSKKLTAKKRDALFDVILEVADDYCIASATEKEIDERNILQATFLAMNRAFDGLREKPDLALVDGNRNPGVDATGTCWRSRSSSRSTSSRNIKATARSCTMRCCSSTAFPRYIAEAFSKTSKNISTNDERGTSP